MKVINYLFITDKVKIITFKILWFIFKKKIKAYHILSKDSRSYTGNFAVDEDILRKECNVTDFEKYSVVPGKSKKKVF